MTTTELSKIAKLSPEALALLRDDLGPSKYVAVLSENKLYKDAVKFLAHGMPVNVAIKWGLACAKELRAPDQEEKTKPSIEVTEAWLKTPDDKTRWQAKKVADDSGMETAADCVAMAVFFSGGSIAPEKAPNTPPPPYSANKFVAGGISMAVVSHEPEKAPERYQKALDLGRAQVAAESAGGK
ncbi:MAG: hypothetical protein JO022_15855 [Acidobacteriaceae bacterium]|nr:hypothetical protein [Acidobacteriaceae bacterium]